MKIKSVWKDEATLSIQSKSQLRNLLEAVDAKHGQSIKMLFRITYYVISYYVINI